GVVRRVMAACAGSFSEEQGLPAHLGFSGLLGIQLAVDAQLRGRREVQELLEFRHEMDLAASFQDVDTLFRGDHRIPIEIGPALLKLRKVLDASEGSLGPERALNVHPAERWGINAMPELLRTDVAGLMRARVRMAVGMTVETTDTPTGALRAPVLGLVELLLRKRSEQQSQALELLGIQDSVEQLVVVLNGHQFPLRHVAETGPCREINGRWKFRQDMLG